MTALQRSRPAGYPRKSRVPSSGRYVLERLERYVDAAAAVIDGAVKLGVSHSILFLHSEAGPPVLNIDNFRSVSDELRMGAGIGHLAWQENPVFARLRADPTVIGSETVGIDSYLPLARRFGCDGPALRPLVIPLLDPMGWFATLVHGNDEPLPLETERRLVMSATELSVWCTARGIGRVPTSDGRGDLPARRYRIAQLAAQGLTNAEIAQTLAISINTVKSRLKQVFVQLEVDNRTELATVLRRLAPLRDVKLGVTRVGGLSITRITL